MTGRPHKINMKDKAVAKQVEQFGSLAATHEEMANWFGCSVRTIERYMADEDSPFCRVYKKARSKFNQSLRRMQIRSAEDGNATMQIWLGKQMLKQRDVSKLELAGDQDKPIKTESKIDIVGVAKDLKGILD